MSQNSNVMISDTHNRKELGNAGEHIVITHLQNKGFSILGKNYRKRFGEIDIVARKQDVLAFIEVKLRKKEYFPLSQVIIISKQQKIIRAAKAFILEHTIHNVLYRFDIALVAYDENKQPNLTYIENAFTDTTD